MTEEQIRDGYARLDGALAPPSDVETRVRRAVVTRRRRRRTAVACGGALALVVGGGAVVAALSGDDGGPNQAVDTPREPRPALVLTRPDGSTYGFTDLTVSCDPPPFAGGPAKGADRIWLYSDFALVGDEDGAAGEGERLQQPFLLLEAKLSEMQPGRTFRLPVDGPRGTESYPLTLFVADTEGAPDGNEVVSGAMDSAGELTVREASCDPEPVLDVVVDVTLGSEEQKQPLDLAGSFS